MGRLVHLESTDSIRGSGTYRHVLPLDAKPSRGS